MNNPWFGKERRRMVRVSAALELKYRVLEKPEIERMTLSKDISGVGVGLLLDEELKEGTGLKLMINLPDEAVPVLATGEVVWSKRIFEKGKAKFSTGIKFSKIEPSDEKKLLKHLYGRY